MIDLVWWVVGAILVVGVMFWRMRRKTWGSLTDYEADRIVAELRRPGGDQGFEKFTMLCRACEEFCFSHDPEVVLAFFETHMPHAIRDKAER
jgi:hypothetical protein